MAPFVGRPHKASHPYNGCCLIIFRSLRWKFKRRSFATPQQCGRAFFTFSGVALLVFGEGPYPPP
jgi:hypothetical protein